MWCSGLHVVLRSTVLKLATLASVAAPADVEALAWELRRAACGTHNSSIYTTS